MPNTYPIVKIPPLIANAKSQEIEDNTAVNEKLTQPSKSSRLVLHCRQIGYTLLFLSTLIFAVAVVRDIKIISYSVISFCLGIGTVNLASLLNLPQVTKQQINYKGVKTIPTDYESLLQGKVL